MKKIITNTFSVSFIALLSRILGVSRDVIIATIFGATIYSDIFFLVFRVPDFLRKMFSEGILSSSFVPVFSQYLKKGSKDKAFEMANSAFFFITFCSTFLTIFGILFAPLVMGFFAQGFSSNSYELSLAVLLSRIMMPYFIFVGLLAVCMGILNSMGSFKIPAFAPVVFNIVIIFFALILSKYFDPPVIGLAIGVTAGGLAQLLLQIPFLIRKKVFKLHKIVLIHPGVLDFVKKLLPAIIGSSTFHINLLIATFLASFSKSGNISSLYYADRLVQLPMGLISVSLAIVFLPLFSKKAVLKNKNESVAILMNGLKFIFFIIFPAMAGLILLNEPVVKLFFYHGAFDLDSVKSTCVCLSYLVSGLWAYSGTRIIVSFFHAFSDVKTPLHAGIIVIFTNFILSALLMKAMGFKGILLTIAISGALNFVILIIKLNSIVKFSYKDITFSACRAVFISGIMYFIIKILILQINNILDFTMPASISVALSVIAGILVYFGVHVLIDSPEVRMIKKEILKSSKK
jgi:putative peptidoglycan lipid II flippase